MVKTFTEKNLRGLILIEASAHSQQPVSRKAVTAEELERMLKPLHESIVAVTSKTVELRAENLELRRANEALEQMKARDFFRFAQTIDADSFRICAAVFVHGNKLKAAKALGLPESTLRSQINKWKECGPAYQKLYDLVQWRARTKGKVADEDSAGLLRPATDHPGMLAELCKKVLSINSENWEEIVEELQEMIEARSSR